MSDKKTIFAPASKGAVPKRPSTVSNANASSSSRRVLSAAKEKPHNMTKTNTNTTAGNPDITTIKEEGSMDNSDALRRKMAYGEILRLMLQGILLDEKIEREQTEVDIQMAQLVDRFQKTVEVLDKTYRRLKDVSFVVEQKRLLDLISKESDIFYEKTETSNAQELLQNLVAAEQSHLNKLKTKNIDFGYNKETGHKQLLDAVNEALDGFNEIKAQSNLDLSKFKEYEKSKTFLEDIEKDRIDLGSLKADIDEKFPEYSKELLEDCTEKIADVFERHAGYSYCGACAAFAYRQISPVVVKRIFILGPSHHVRLGGCALSSLDKYSTPLYDLTIDKQIYAELEATRQFEWMDVQTDEDEHSIEMQLPYIAKVMEEYQTGFTIIPILVGSLTTDKEAKYGSILAPYLADPQNLLVISSDFCHWGSRFRYTWRDGSDPIYQSIERLDRQGMDLIEKMDPRAFSDYLNRYGNTICGRHPIGVLLQAISKLRAQPTAPKMSLKFLKYAQSSQCMSPQDSSVSYASASLVFE